MCLPLCQGLKCPDIQLSGEVLFSSRVLLNGEFWKRLMKRWWSCRRRWTTLSSFTDILWSFMALRQWSSPALLLSQHACCHSYTFIHTEGTTTSQPQIAHLITACLLQVQFAFRAASYIKTLKRKISHQTIPTLIKPSGHHMYLTRDESQTVMKHGLHRADSSWMIIKW